MPNWNVGGQKFADLLEADVLYLFEYRLAGGRAEALLCDAPREGKLCKYVGRGDAGRGIAADPLYGACNARVAYHERSRRLSADEAHGPELEVAWRKLRVCDQLREKIGGEAACLAEVQLYRSDCRVRAFAVHLLVVDSDECEVAWTLETRLAASFCDLYGSVVVNRENADRLRKWREELR